MPGGFYLQPCRCELFKIFNLILPAIAGILLEKIMMPRVLTVPNTTDLYQKHLKSSQLESHRKMEPRIEEQELTI